ncbi:MAG: hypothetical protein K6U89_10970 [Chloroflexi bacterium]|nr:hypothetical protein [Chloroflexota bacterium]
MGDPLVELMTLSLGLLLLLALNLALLGLIVLLPVALARWAYQHLRRRYLPPLVPGRVSAGLRDFAGQTNRRAVQWHLRRVLPPWPVSSALLEAAGELADLRAGVAAAVAAGVPPGLLRPLNEEIAQASEALWRLADRVSAAAAQRVPYPLVAPQLEPERERLGTLVLAARQAREGLACLVLSHTSARDLEQAERRLRALGEATRTIATLPGA